MIFRSRWARQASAKLAVFSLMLLLVLGVSVAALPPSPGLRILCSNNIESCEAVAARFHDDSGTRVQIVRIPTSAALTRLEDSFDEGEFDVWMGGPVDAYALAQSHGMLAEPSADMREEESTRQWFDIYGGILAFCVSDNAREVTSWAELAASNERIALPNPLLSGTAVTMLALHQARLGSLEGARDYMRQLDQHTTVYTDSGTAPASLVVAGRVDIGVAFAPYCEREAARGAHVHTVVPRDGTSYEIGGVAVLASAAHNRAAWAFVRFASSPDGQSIGAAASMQAPISRQLANNLSSRITRITTPVYSIDPFILAIRRPELIDMWREEVRRGQF